MAYHGDPPVNSLSMFNQSQPQPCPTCHKCPTCGSYKPPVTPPFSPPNGTTWIYPNTVSAPKVTWAQGPNTTTTMTALDYSKPAPEMNISMRVDGDTGTRIYNPISISQADAEQLDGYRAPEAAE